MSEEGEVRLEYDEEEEEARIEAEKAEEKHWEDTLADIDGERWKEELDQRRWKWIGIARAFNAPIKVLFT